MSYPLQFLISFITTLGFSYFFQVRRRALLSASFAGAMGWVLCAYCVDHGMSLIFANFFAALLIAFLAEIFARFEKIRSRSTSCRGFSLWCRVFASTI